MRQNKMTMILLPYRLGCTWPWSWSPSHWQGCWWTPEPSAGETTGTLDPHEAGRRISAWRRLAQGCSEQRCEWRSADLSPRWWCPPQTDEPFPLRSGVQRSGTGCSWISDPQGSVLWWMRKNLNVSFTSFFLLFYGHYLVNDNSKNT